ncbi:MAG: hypothetical protein U9R42_05335 [Bacteroidota bacterium]|nr:hypothetical protein [Bacteroidota bacterium]
MIEKQANPSKKKDRTKTLLFIFIILLLGSNAFLLVKLNQKKNVEEDLLETTELKEQLAQEVADYKDKVEEYQGTVYEKDSLLQEYDKQMKEKVAEIEKLIQQKRITRYRYNKALEEIKKLEYYTKKYQKQIDELKKKNKKLTEENVNLKTGIKEYKKEVDNLTDENVELSNKVNLGSMLRTNTISIIGLKEKWLNDKLTETMKGKKMIAIKMVFSFKDNILAKKGDRECYIKIINPKGETLYLEERGSGQFPYQGEQSLYTLKSTINFSNESDSSYTVVWDRGSEFEQGNYQCQVFNNGVKIGAKKFEIK